jgi:hypothetical protein
MPSTASGSQITPNDIGVNPGGGVISRRITLNLLLFIGLLIAIPFSSVVNISKLEP